MGIVGWEFEEVLAQLCEACDVIYNVPDGCIRCPLQDKCIADRSFLDVAQDAKRYEFEEMIDYANECLDRVSDEDYEASKADEQRKADIEQQMIDEENEW